MSSDAPDVIEPLFSRDVAVRIVLAVLVALLLLEVLSASLDVRVVNFQAWPLIGPAVLLLLRAVSYKALRRFVRVRAIMDAYALYLILIFIGVVLSYFSTMTDLSARDEFALQFDRAIGFRWYEIMISIDQYPTLVSILRAIYSTIWLQGFVILAALVFARRFDDVRLFFVAFLSAFLLTLVLSIIDPVAGVLSMFPNAKFHYLTFSGGTDSIPAFLDLRAHSLRVIDLGVLLGVIQFPSFHVVMAVLWPYAARNLRIFPLVLLFNAGLSLSALTEGGHYLFDVLGGLFVGVSTILLVSLAVAIRRKGRSTAPQVASPRALSHTRVN